jgi:tRNA pseudouridine synthase 10
LAKFLGDEMKVIENLVTALKDGYLCDHCLGRLFSNLLTGYTNEERGKILRTFAAFLLDSGEKLDVDLSNFYGIRFRNVKLQVGGPKECKVCKNFFEKEIDTFIKKALEKLNSIEFESFLVGCVPTEDMVKAEEELWTKVGIEFVEPIKSEINREIGKRLEKITNKKFKLENPDITIIFDLQAKSIKLQIRSLFIFGKYKKLRRGIPQCKWICPKCNGKGCTYCGGKGKLYPTSVQEIIEKPLLKLTKSKKSRFSGGGREDINVRCLDWRPFVIEILKPIKRKINLKSVEREINKSSAVKVKGLKFTNKETVRAIKSERADKTYLADILFSKKLDKEKLKELKELEGKPILQKTPTRVLHRRADKVRKRLVKELKWKLISPRRLILKIKAESGLYVKELITGDEGRTKPSISEILNNEPKKISLDVIKIHTKW